MHAGRRFFVLSLAILPLAGCGGQGFTSADVTGTVKLDGKPVPGLMVQFEPKDGEGTRLPPGMGLTNAEGKFVILRPGGKSGAVVGSNTVRVLSGEGSELAKIGGRQVEGAVSEFEVKPGPNVIDIELRLK